MVHPDTPGAGNSLPNILRAHAERQPERRCYTFLRDGETDAVHLSYGQLDRQARGVAALLQGAGVTTGERVLIVHPPGLGLITALFGCYYAGVTAVPTYPPNFNPHSKASTRFVALAADAQVEVALTSQTWQLRAERFGASLPAELTSLRWLASDELDTTAADDWQPPAIDPAALAMLQYTSGSTAAPKGVMLSHANLVSNLAAIGHQFGHTVDSQGVIWLPPYHDMGLIGGILMPIALGASVVLMEPAHFLQRPLRWLQAISRYRATTSGGPNFAYELCLEKISAEDRQSLDLSSWSLAFNGAEPVRAETLRRFHETFADCGFQPEAFYPTYGLAEATLLVTGENRSAGHATAHTAPGTAQQAGADQVTPATVSCGTAIREHQVRIVDPQTRLVCAEGDSGEIWVAGPSVAVGYWNRPRETADTFGQQLAPSGQEARSFLRTGDLGRIVNGELAITGRSKDLIILRGRNYYPQDLEETASHSHPALTSQGSAAFAIERDGVEQLVIACEVRRDKRRQLDPQRAIRAVRGALSAQHQVRASQVMLLKPGSLPRTTSGKIQRHACRHNTRQQLWKPLAEENLGSHQVATDSVTAERELLQRLHRRTLAAEDLNTLDSLQQQQHVKQYLTSLIADTLDFSPEQIEPDRPLAELGIDSLTRIELLAKIDGDLDTDLPLEILDPEGTLNELAGRIVTQRAAGPATPDERSVPVAGEEVPLTPTQQEFLAPGIENPGGFAIVVYLRAPHNVSHVALETACRWLQQRHDVFQLRFTRDGDHWSQRYGDPQQPLDFQHWDGQEAPQRTFAEWSQQLEEVLKLPFDLAAGPLARMILLNRGENEPSLLVISVHHLIADALSVPLLVDDLERCYRRCLRNEPGPGVRASLSFGAWSRALSDYAESSAITDQLDYWRTVSPGRPEPVQPIVSEPVAAPEESAEPPSFEWLAGDLTESLTGRLLHRFPQTQQQHDAILAAMVYSWWQQQDQQRLCRIVLRQHGRFPLAGRSPKNTLGWMMFHFPVCVPSLDNRMVSDLDPLDCYRHVRQTLKRVPGGGIGYGLLRYLHPDREVQETMRRLPQGDLLLAYPGRLLRPQRSQQLFSVLDTQVRKNFRRLCTDDSSRTNCYARLQRDRIGWVLKYDPKDAKAVQAFTQGMARFLEKLAATRDD